ncbi:lytic transglycosylase [Pseudomonas sp. ICMP 8385]|uniref:transglycosylase SLT domain-containing protein n=1 Tax=Pseudomonas sp. ICMP 8385 TaxID=1718920 RepID=UPI000C070031|nr:transglycosylase SLT domain-containing protein [Pseudomonas sp. ICMP 8385]PHN53584.1 lytic transglycosylase [Pseudomonas sp. ICMP 8385]
MATSMIGHCTALLLVPTLLDPSALTARELPPPAYQLAAAQARVPPNLLYAVALQESGRNLRGRTVPWPWTLNVAGQPRRYGTRREACADLRQVLQLTPATRVDVGLGQLNAGYQRHRVRQPCELLEPYRNLRLAATILREQYNPNQSWLMAAGRYHRPAGGAPAVRYRQQVGQHLARLEVAASPRRTP